METYNSGLPSLDLPCMDSCARRPIWLSTCKVCQSAGDLLAVQNLQHELDPDPFLITVTFQCFMTATCSAQQQTLKLGPTHAVTMVTEVLCSLCSCQWKAHERLQSHKLHFKWIKSKFLTLTVSVALVWRLAGFFVSRRACQVIVQTKRNLLALDYNSCFLSYTDRVRVVILENVFLAWQSGYNQIKESFRLTMSRLSEMLYCTRHDILITSPLKAAQHTLCKHRITCQGYRVIIKIFHRIAAEWGMYTQADFPIGL